MKSRNFATCMSSSPNVSVGDPSSTYGMIDSPPVAAGNDGLGRFLLLAASFITLSCVYAYPASGYHVIKKIPLPGDGGWDYVTADSAARRLYVSHNEIVQVLDLDTLAVVGQIPDTLGVHGIALAPTLGRGFTSNGKAGTVTLFDLSTLKPLTQVKAGQNPDALVYDPFTQRVFAFNGRSHDATAIEAATGKILGQIALDGKPEFTVADGSGTVYVNLEDKGTLVRIDAQKLKVLRRWPLAPCEEPSTMAMDRAHERLFIGCGNKKLVVMDPEQGQVVATLPIGDHVDATVFDAEKQLIFTSNGEGTVTVIHEDAPDHYTVVDTVPTQAGARTEALDTHTHRLFLPTAELGPRPDPTTEQPHPRPAIKPGTFTLLVVGAE